MKIGMYSSDEIYDELANGFLHHSMVDAMYFEIKKLREENQQLKKSIKLFTDDLANMTNRALQLEKQKDDVVEIINKQLLSNTNITKYTDEMCLRHILRMLGEIDE